MTTAALLPTPGDPLLAAYWCENYLTWRDQVDELVVLINGDPAAAPVYEAVGAHVRVVAGRMGHGEAMRELLGMTEADAVVYVEDDAFVLHPDAVGNTLFLVGDHLTDVVGCPRGGMDPRIGEAALAKWGPVVGRDGSSGHGLWPAFLFARRKDLLATSRRFESWTWYPGNVIPGLGYECPDTMTTDTMTTIAFELRERFNHIKLTVNYKEMDQKVYPGPDDKGHQDIVPWFHAGGLSNDPASARADMGDSNEGRDWAHRFWWWRHVGHDYSEHIARAAVDVDYWTPIIEPWLTWE